MAAGKFLAPWDQTLKWFLFYHPLMWTVPPRVFPCEMRLSAKKGSNGKVLNVRCRCMAGTNCTPSRRYCNYDPIGEASSLAEARELWQRHTQNTSTEVAA